MSVDVVKFLDRIERKFDKLERKIDKHQDILFTHINNDTKMLEQLTTKFRVIENEQRWFKRVGIWFCAIAGSMVTWVITYLSGVRR